MNMWIMVSVVVTCIVLVIINVIMSIRDSKFKQKFESQFDSKVKHLMTNNLRLNEEIDKLKLEHVDFKNEIMHIHHTLMDIKVELSTDSLNFNKNFREIEIKVDLALISIKNIQDSYLASELNLEETSLVDTVEKISDIEG